MKNILVPTDFSACAAHAESLAIRLAQRMDAVIYLYTQLDLPDNWDKMNTSEQAEYPEARKRIANAEALMNDLQSRYPTVSMQRLYSGGHLAESLQAYADLLDIDLIIMGSHGSSGFKDFFVGSNTQRVIRSVHSPVLVVKNAVEELDFNKVAYVSTFEASEQAAFLRFKALVSAFEPSIHLVNIRQPTITNVAYPEQEKAMKAFVELAQPLHCEYHLVSDFQIENGVNYFAQKIGAKLIGIANHRHSALSRMLVGSTVETLINLSNLPVLSIDYKQ